MLPAAISHAYLRLDQRLPCKEVPPLKLHTQRYPPYQAKCLFGCNLLEAWRVFLSDNTFEKGRVVFLKIEDVPWRGNQ